jgi:hypothetical protein
VIKGLILKKSRHWIDWERHEDKLKDLIVGHAYNFSGVPMPLFKIKSIGIGIPKGVVFSFLPEDVRAIPLAYITKGK